MKVELLKIAEVASQLKIHPRSVVKLIHSGRLVAINVSTSSKKLYRVRSVDLEAFIQGEVAATKKEPRKAVKEYV